MIKNTSNILIAFLAFSVFVTVSCVNSSKKEVPLVVTDNSPDPIKYAREIRDKVPAKVADGLQLKLWATDSLAPDPVSIDVDNNGAVYLTRTIRQKHSEFDIRGYQHWVPHTISWNTVEDRRKFLRDYFAPEKSNNNSWLEDLNGDGSHDWKDLAVEQDELWKIEDLNHDGVAERSTRIFLGPNEEVTDVVGGVLVRENDMFIATAPDVWRVQDTNGDGFYDKKTSIATGFQVHIGFSGHGMSGLTEGPDGKIYWNTGDIGANITTVDGRKIDYANEGTIVRCNPDGSDLEVFAHGLRNTHEFVFDQYGNLISSDNDGDHPGERERLVHVVEGMDAGWRCNWQYGKYTDPKNNKYKVWMDEKLSVPRWEGQAAYILPPIMNYHNGPTGMQYNPGTALGKDWLNKFFLVEFVGSPSSSHIWSFGLKNKGASFVLDGEKDMVSGILPTGIKFGPDGALYVADWLNGWDTKNKGRVWRMDVSNQDLTAERQKTQAYLQLKYPLQTDLMLLDLLAYEDMRIRQKAQFELVNRGAKGLAIFKKTLDESKNQLAKVHAIWGIGMLARKDKTIAENLMPVLESNDEELVAQAAKTLGDIKYTPAASKLIGQLRNENARIKFYAAEALGRIGSKEAIKGLIQMLEENNDADLYIRHAGVLALSRIGAEEQAAALSYSSTRALRTAGVLVLRKLGSPKIVAFLKDSDEYIVTEAARAINDDLSIPGAFEALVEILKHTTFKGEPLMRRAINVALRLGDKKSLEALIAYSERNDISDELRAEAIATLGTWAEPSPLDRVDGRYRGVVKRDLEWVKSIIRPHVDNYLSSENPATKIAVASLLSNLKISEYSEKLAELFEKETEPKVKIGIIESLNALKFNKLNEIVKKGLKDEKSDVRAAAIGALDNIETDVNSFNEILKPIFEKGSLRERQRLLTVIGNIPLEKTEKVLESLIAQQANGNLNPELLLDLTEAVKKTGSENLIVKLNATKKEDNWFEEFKVALFGGNSWEGRRIFNSNSTAQCVRCHAIEPGTGGNVGPSLEKIGSKLKRETLLEALISPSARISPGFGQVIITPKDGNEVMGTLMSETENELVIATSDAEPTKVQTARIAKRENVPSSMPPMGEILSKREIRDLVEFLSSLK
jgi:putative membrane-bound dehydrogenase-like protein